MNDTPTKGQKLKRTLHLTKAADDILNFGGYCNERERGEFISALIVDYDTRVQQAKSSAPPPPPTRGEIVAELRRLVDLLEAD